MRTINALKNVITNLLLQIVVAVSGILIPQFFIAIYGSEVNGLVASITQFITYMGLVEAGIGAAGMVALFKPLALDDKDDVNSIVSAARKFYLQSGMLFLALVIALICVYPYIVQTEINNQSFVRMMVFVLSINGIIDYFFLGKYRVLLNADQKMYIISLAQIIGTVIVTILSIILMKMNCSALLVKSIAAGVYVFRSILVAGYVKWKYKWINFHAIPNTSAFSQRWAALTHQIVGMIVNNTDIVLLTVLLSKAALIQVSIYSVYNMVGYALTSALNSITNSLGAGFGEIISKGEIVKVKETYSTYEYLFYILIFAAYTCMITLLHPFMRLYSLSFSDAALYVDWKLVILFTIAGVFQTMRLPGLTLITAAGHYKQTQFRAIIEAAINLTVSVGLIFHFEIIGVLIGTCASYAYRTIDVILYSARNFAPGTLRKTAGRIARNGLASSGVAWIGIRFITNQINTWLDWILCACCIGSLMLTFLFIINFLFEPKEFKNVFLKFKSVFNR